MEEEERGGGGGGLYQQVLTFYVNNLFLFGLKWTKATKRCFVTWVFFMTVTIFEGKFEGKFRKNVWNSWFCKFLFRDLRFLKKMTIFEWKIWKISENFGKMFKILDFEIPQPSRCGRKRTSDGNIIWKFYCLNFCGKRDENGKMFAIISPHLNFHGTEKTSEKSKCQQWDCQTFAVSLKQIRAQRFSLS